MEEEGAAKQSGDTAAIAEEEAVEIATLMSDEDTLILATGSLAYLGRVINVIGRTYNR